MSQAKHRDKRKYYDGKMRRSCVLVLITRPGRVTGRSIAHIQEQARWLDSGNYIPIPETNADGY